MPAPNEDIGGSPPNLTLPLSSSSGGSTGPLLRSHTVPQLRELAQSLAQDRDARRAELQLMVGSKYHDFIESADEISSMNSAARDVAESLLAVASQSHSVVEQTSFLLTTAAVSAPSSSISVAGTKKSTPEASVVGPKQGGSGFSPADTLLSGCMLNVFWTSISECNIFSAAKALIISFAFHRSKMLGCDSNIDFLAREPSPLSSVVGGGGGGGGGSSRSDNGGVTPAPAASLHSLWETTLEDAALLLLQENTGGGGKSTADSSSFFSLPSVEIARVLVAMRYLLVHPLAAPRCSDVSSLGLLPFAKKLVAAGAHFDLSGWKSSLELYLAAISNKVESLLVLDMHVNQSQHGGESVDVDRIIRAIDTIKIAILNVFIIFFNRDPEASIMIHNEHLMFAASVERSLLAAGLSFPALQIACPRDVAGLREVWSNWFFGSEEGSNQSGGIKGMANIMTNACVACLKRIKQSGEVSVIQARVKKSCLTCPYPEDIDDQSCALLWSHACKALLQRHRGFRPGDAEDESPLHSELLWSRVLQIPFLHQIENALAESAGKSLLRIQKRIQLSLKKALAIEIAAMRQVSSDIGSTFTLSISVSPNSSGSPDSHAKEIVDGAVALNELKNDGLSSSEIFAIAHTWASHLDAEIRSLRAGVGGDAPQVAHDPPRSDQSRERPLTNEDARDDSVHSLSLLVQANCTQLVGQVLAMVRSIALRICGTVTSFCKSPPALDGKVDRVEDALLLLGRFCWLLRVGGYGIASALKFGSNRVSPPGAQDAVYYSSLSQLQSAFEIADGDGDGLLNYTEAVEAMGALGLSNESGFDQSASRVSCLWPHEGLLSSALRGLYRPESMQFSFAEFACACAKFCRTANQMESLSNLIMQDLDDLSLLCHNSWVKSFVSQGMHVLQASLKQDVRSCVSNASSKDESMVPNYLVSWKKCSLRDVSDDQNDDASQLYLPNSVSAPLHSLLLSLIGKVSTKVCSVDSMQAALGSSWDSVSLSLFERTRLDATVQAFKDLFVFYMKLIKECNGLGNMKLLPGFGSSGEVDGFFKLQLLFDILFIKELTYTLTEQSHSTEIFGIEQAVSVLCDDLDPVSVQLALPVLRERAKVAVSGKVLLFGFGGSLVLRKSEDGASHSESVLIDDVFASASLNHQFRLGLLPVPALGTAGISSTLAGLSKERGPPEEVSSAPFVQPGAGASISRGSHAVLAGVQRGIAAVWS